MEVSKVLLHFRRGDWASPLNVMQQFMELTMSTWNAWVAYDVADQSNVKIIMEKFADAWACFLKLKDPIAATKVFGIN